MELYTFDGFFSVVILDLTSTGSGRIENQIPACAGLTLRGDLDA